VQSQWQAPGWQVQGSQSQALAADFAMTAVSLFVFSFVFVFIVLLVQSFAFELSSRSAAFNAFICVNAGGGKSLQ
jgi:hypothetical protein